MRKKVNISLAILAAITLLRLCRLPKVYNSVIMEYVDDGEKLQYKVNDMIYAVCNSAMLMACAFIIHTYHKNLETAALFGLAIGKLIDEFGSPFGYSEAEMIWDIIVASIYTYKKYQECTQHPTK